MTSDWEIIAFGTWDLCIHDLLGSLNSLLERKEYPWCGVGDRGEKQYESLDTNRLNLEDNAPLFKCQNIPFLYNAEKSQNQNKNRARLKCIHLDAETGCLWCKCSTSN